MKFFIRIITIMCSFFFFAITASGQNANFTADYIAGCEPLVVHFTNTSTGATSYFWDLGNTTTTTITNPSTSYTSAGTYTVKLTAYNGSSSSVRTLVITVYPRPTVNFTASPTTVCAGAAVVFNSTSTSGVPGPMNYSWNYGDGSIGSGNPGVHAYASGGTYNVALYVTNSQGCTQSYTRNAYITVNPKPVPNFGGSPTSSCSAPLTVNFTNTSSGSAPLTYAWTFGDGGTSNVGSPSHPYTGFGSYNVSLTVTDANGCQNTLTRPSYVNILSLNASMSGPSTGCIAAPLTYTNTSTGTIFSSTWDFGDGSTSTGTSSTHSYTSAGTYTVRLITSNGACSDTAFQTVVISPSPLSSYTITPPFPCPAPVTRNFNASVVPGSTVVWDFGDGSTGSGTSTSHTYTANGATTIKLYVTSPAGCRDSVIRRDTIFDLIPVITDTPSSGCKPLTVNFGFTASTTVPTGIMHAYPYVITSYSWNFGDGSPVATTPAPAHVYTAVGVYTVSCTITTANGCPATDTAIVYVGEPPVISFTATPTHVCAHQSVTFTSAHTGTVTIYNWNFGDGTSATDSVGTTVHNYDWPGVFTPTLTAYYNGCPSAPYVFHNIVVDSPRADFQISYLCTPRTRAHFTNLSIGATTWLWQFGDGFTDAVTWSPSHDYAALTTYTVTLSAYNATSGCRDTVKKVVDFTRPIFNFAANDTTVCKWDTVTFTPVVTGGAASGFSWWDNGAFMGSSAGASSFSYPFTATGWHTIMAIMTDSRGCFDTLIKNSYVLVAKPTGNFTAAPTTICAYTPITFTDASTAVPGTSLTSYTWLFGDGGVSTGPAIPVTHTYTASGVYTVTEIMTDNIGCKDTIAKPAYINIAGPVANFHSITLPCKNMPVAFTNTSTGASTYTWLFGDGGTSTLASPTHAYATNGTYTVKLVAVDAAGCRDTMTFVNYITVTGPNAAFTMSDSVSVCPPLVVAFTNGSSGGAINYQWAFGDGNTSTLLSPSNMYTATGNYTVTLVAKDAAGCTDTARRRVFIYGSSGGFSYAPLTGCAPHTVNFTANVINIPSIIWDFADGTTSPPSSSTTITHVYTQPGAYIPRLVLADGTGCQTSSPGIDTIKVNEVKAGFQVPLGMCEFLSFTLTDTSFSYWSTVNSWYWNFNGDTSTTQSPTFTAGAAGVYTVMFAATDGWGCTDTLRGDLTIYPPPVVDAGGDTIVCFGDDAVLLATGANTYVWADGATLSCTACNPTHANPPAPMTYTVVGTDIHGCTDWDTTHVSHRFKTVSEAFDGGEICSGTTLLLHDTGATKFTWFPPNWLSDPASGNPVATPLGSLTYTVIAQLAGCIPDTNTLTIIVHATPGVDAGPDQTLATGSVATLHATATNATKYSWADGVTLDCDTCALTHAQPDVTTTYTVTVTNDFGCKAVDSVTIFLYCNDNQIFVPNSFTPNGDGQNDLFYPRGSGVKNIKSFRIYNRWGQLLFSRSDIPLNDESNAWDGSYGGMSPRPDVYVYIVEGICGNGKPMFIKGDVTIIR